MCVVVVVVGAAVAVTIFHLPPPPPSHLHISWFWIPFHSRMCGLEPTIRIPKTIAYCCVCSGAAAFACACSEPLAGFGCAWLFPLWGACAGVRLGNGREIASRAIVMATGYFTTLMRSMLKAETVAPMTIVRSHYAVLSPKSPSPPMVRLWRVRF